jgi:hypothetical protein
MDAITRFEVGKTYSTRSICDHNCIYRITVLSRTAKTIRVRIGGERDKTLRPYVYRDAEQVKPFGSYSMCAIIGADDTRELRPDWERERMGTVAAAYP